MKVGEVVAGRFKVLAHIGEGGMGTVFKAEDLQRSRLVALKVLISPESSLVERFLLEAKTLSALEHPAIVGYVAHGLMHDHQPYLAMDWLDGTDLSKTLRTRPLSISQTLVILKRIASGLGYAHTQKIVHRDLKPANIMLVGDQPSQATLVDFGVARPRGLTRGLTRTGAIIGTVGYMSPEQLRGVRGIDGRADLFALGCVAFECLTGRAAYVGDNIAAVLAGVLLGETPHIREIAGTLPQELDALVAKLMHPDMEQRFADGAAVIAALDGLPAQTHEIEHTLLAPSDQRPRLLFERTPIATVLLWSSDAASESINGEDASVAQVDERDALAAGQKIAERWGATCTELADGALLLACSQGTAISERVSRAARAALDLLDALPNWNLSLTLSQTESGEHGLGRPVLSPAAWSTRATQSITSLNDVHGITVDDATASLLSTNFHVERVGTESILRSYTASRDDARLILGRAAPCVGREKELQLLLATLDEVMDEEAARMVVIVAPPGVGKSRVRREFVARISDRPALRIALAKGDIGANNTAFSIMQQWIESVHGVRESSQADTPEGRWRELSAKATEILRLGGSANPTEAIEYLGELANCPTPHPSAALQEARNNAQQMRQRLTSVFESWLRGLAKTETVIFLLEDCHWADAATLSVLLGVWESLSNVPVYVVVTTWPEGETQFPALFAAKNTTLLKLEPLGKRAAERVVRQLLGPDVPATTIAQVVEMSAGNAFLLEEIVRHVGVNDKLDDLPTSAVALVQSRLRQLPSGVRKVLRLASVFGAEFRASAIERMYAPTDSDPVNTHEALQRLRQEELLISPADNTADHNEHTIEGSLWSFRHSLVQKAAYEMLTTSDRIHAHHTAAEWMIAHSPERPAEIAAHFEKANALNRMAEYYLKAIDIATDLGEFQLVAELAARCDTAGVTGGLRAEALFNALFSAVFLERFDQLGMLEERTNSDDLDRRSVAWFNLKGSLISMKIHGGIPMDVEAECRELFAQPCLIYPTFASVMTFSLLLVSLMHTGFMDRARQVADAFEKSPMDVETYPALTMLRDSYVPCLLAADDDPRGLEQYRLAIRTARTCATPARFVEVALPCVWLAAEFGFEDEARTLLDECERMSTADTTQFQDWLIFVQAHLGGFGRKPVDCRHLMAKHTHPEWRHVHFGLRSSVIFSTVRTHLADKTVIRECLLELDALAAETGSMVSYRNIFLTLASYCANVLNEHERALVYTESLVLPGSVLFMSTRTLMTLQRLTALRATRSEPGRSAQLERELGLAKSRLLMIASGLSEADRPVFLDSEFVRATFEFATH